VDLTVSGLASRCGRRTGSQPGRAVEMTRAEGYLPWPTPGPSSGAGKAKAVGLGELAPTRTAARQDCQWWLDRLSSPQLTESPGRSCLRWSVQPVR
jgi:hypothetical protein